PTANAIGRGENFDLRAVNEIGHKAGLIIGSQPKSDGPRRSVTAVSGVRLKVRMTAETVTEAVEYAGIAVHIAVPAVGFRAEER
ncbi:hypothetical protein, partial [Roseovarius autotrophicus]|uniref:hypothetical protein n=1 Tax=Roseovarius autotrophicus TaxID=2824121 RepID=UPI001B369C40